MKKRIQYVVPAAGLGSRFKVAGFTTIKPLIPVGNIPMIIWPISNLSLEPQDILIIVTKKGDDLSSIRTRWFRNIRCQIEFIEMDNLSEGPASTVEAALGFIDLELPLVVLNSDQYVSTPIANYINELRTCYSESFGSILTMKAVGNKWSYIGRDRLGNIEKIVEKNPISTEATVGIYAWSNAKLFATSLKQMKNDELRTNNEFYVAPSYNYLIDRKKQKI